MSGRHLLAAALALSLTGCVESEVFVMQNPKNGEIVQCRSGNTGPSIFPIVQGMMDNAAARDCAHGYEAAGWKVMNKKQE